MSISSLKIWHFGTFSDILNIYDEFIYNQWVDAHSGWVFISRGYHQPSRQHFCVDMSCHSYGHIYKLTVLQNFDFFKYYGLSSSGTDYIRSFFGKIVKTFWSNALLLSTLFAILTFLFECHRWVFCRRNNSLAQIQDFNPCIYDEVTYTLNASLKI